MVTIQTADNALKSFYLDAVTEALDTKANPLLAQIQHTTSDVVGKDVRKLVKVGLNGGIGAGSETGDLPTASASDYVQFTATLKNLYGTIERTCAHSVAQLCPTLCRRSSSRFSGPIR